MKLVAKYLTIISLFLYLAAGLFNPLYALFVKSLGGTVLETGISFGIMPLVIAVGLLVSGKYADKWQKETVFLVIAYFIKTVAFFSYIFITSVTQLIFLQMLFGISYVISTPAYESLFSKNLTKGKFASNWATWEALMQFGLGVSAILGSVILANFGFKFLFLAAGVLSFIGFLFSVILYFHDHRKN